MICVQIHNGEYEVSVVMPSGVIYILGDTKTWPDALGIARQWQEGKHGDGRSEAD